MTKEKERKYIKKIKKEIENGIGKNKENAADDGIIVLKNERMNE